jgi:hypothetical protein
MQAIKCICLFIAMAIQPARAEINASLIFYGGKGAVVYEGKGNAREIEVVDGKLELRPIPKMDESWIYLQGGRKIKLEQNIAENMKEYSSVEYPMSAIKKQNNCIVVNGKVVDIKEKFERIQRAYLWKGLLIVEVSIAGDYGSPMNGTFWHSALIAFKEGSKSYQFIDTHEAYFPLNIFKH